jgi:hypothetical protein
MGDRSESIVEKKASGGKMRKTLCAAAIACCHLLITCGMAWATPNYELFPQTVLVGPGGHSYRILVISYEQNSIYDCSATAKGDGTWFTGSKCIKLPTDNLVLMRGDNIKTIYARKYPVGIEEAVAYFWQIDQSTGKIQLCGYGTRPSCIQLELPR